MGSEISPPDDVYDWHLLPESLKYRTNYTSVVTAESFQLSHPSEKLPPGTTRVRVHRVLSSGRAWERYESLLW